MVAEFVRWSASPACVASMSGAADAQGGEGGEEIANGKVFLGGLNYDSTEDSIKTHFEDNFGQVSASRATPTLRLPAEG